jgi:hypothetical protein
MVYNIVSVSSTHTDEIPIKIKERFFVESDKLVL